MNEELIALLEGIAGHLSALVPLASQIGPLAERLDRIEARQDEIIAGLEVLGDVALRSYRATGAQEGLPAEVMDAPIMERAVNRHLADLFLHGSAAAIAAESRLTYATQCQEAMDRHLEAIYQGDPAGYGAARKESREMISAALMRGDQLAISVAAPEPRTEPASASHERDTRLR